MSDFQMMIMVFMSCTFLFGLILGWLVWSFGGSKDRRLLEAEIDFWRSQLELSRQKENVKIQAIEALTQEKADLKVRLSKKAS